jgi:DNA polymerase elongation subunit (family B)
VTAFARLKLLEMKQIASDQFQMNIIYGDTDSIFVSSKTQHDHNLPGAAFTAACIFQADGKVIIKGKDCE